jgi:hypothetical protein
MEAESDVLLQPAVITTEVLRSVFESRGVGNIKDDGV